MVGCLSKLLVVMCNAEAGYGACSRSWPCGPRALYCHQPVACHAKSVQVRHDWTYPAWASCCLPDAAGVKVLDASQYDSPEAGTEAATAELKSTLEGLAAHLFGSGIEVRPFLPSVLLAGCLHVCKLLPQAGGMQDCSL